MDTETLSIILTFVSTGIAGGSAFLWRVYVYRDKKKTQAAEELRTAKNRELDAQRRKDAQSIRRLRKRCKLAEQRAITAEARLKSCLDGQAL